MRKGEEKETAGKWTTYCVIPRDLAPKLHEALKTHFRDDPAIEVIVEHRSAERRRGEERRSGEPVPVKRDRRRIRNHGGRRAGDRRTLTVPVTPPPLPLPRKARRYAGRLSFIGRLEPSGEHLEDIDTGRTIARFQAGDEGAAFTALYERYFDRVYTHLRVLLGDYHEAEDAAQHVFTGAFEALARYEIRADSPFRAWLFRVARNAAIDTLRRRGRVRVEDPARIDRIREENGSRGEENGSKELRSALASLTDGDLAFVIKKLPEAQRQVIAMRYLLDLPTEEIAATLGRSPKAVYHLHARALHTLAEHLTALGHPAARAASARRAPMLTRIKPAPVLAARRFALW